MKQLAIYFLLLLMSIGIYYGMREIDNYKLTFGTNEKKSIISDIKASYAADSYSPKLNVTVTWKSSLIDAEDASLKLEIMVSKSETGKDGKVIAAKAMQGLSTNKDGSGSLTCGITKTEMGKSTPFLLGVITYKIKGKESKPIMIPMGEYE